MLTNVIETYETPKVGPFRLSTSLLNGSLLCLITESSQAQSYQRKFIPAKLPSYMAGIEFELFIASEDIVHNPVWSGAIR